jgi:hypothetical protein
MFRMCGDPPSCLRWMAGIERGPQADSRLTAVEVRATMASSAVTPRAHMRYIIFFDGPRPPEIHDCRSATRLRRPIKCHAGAQPTRGSVC